MQSRRLDRWIVVLLVLCMGGMVAMILHAGQGMRYVDDAKIFADDLVRATATKWDAKPLEEAATEEFQSNAGQGGLDALVAAIGRELGPVVSFQGRVSTIEQRPVEGESATQEVASYFAEGQFKNGPGRLDLVLLKTPTGWRVMQFTGRKL